MAHFSIYIPGAKGASADNLKRVGLDALQQKHGWAWTDVADGPDGKGGLIGSVFHDREGVTAPLRGYNSDLQKWVPIGNRPDLGILAGDFYYGYEPARPPLPIDLAYDRQIRGSAVRLKDGNLWTIPETLKLPMDIGRDPETGELKKLYTDEYADFCRRAEEYAAIFFGGICDLELLREEYPGVPIGDLNVEFSLPDTWDYCCQAIAINYCVAEPIIGPGMLHILDDRLMSYIARASLAFPDILEVIEKKKITSPVTIPVGLTTLPGEVTRTDHRRGSISTS